MNYCLSFRVRPVALEIAFRFLRVHQFKYRKMVCVLKINHVTLVTIYFYNWCTWWTRECIWNIYRALALENRRHAKLSSVSWLFANDCLIVTLFRIQNLVRFKKRMFCRSKGLLLSYFEESGCQTNFWCLSPEFYRYFKTFRPNY